MSTSGPNSTGTGTTASAAGSSFNWATASNITSSNNSYATATASGADGSYSNYLVAKNFGFALAAGDVVTSVLVEYECKVSAQRSSTDHLVYYTLDGSTIVNGVSGSSKFPLVEGYISDTITLPNLTGTQVNSSNFGIMLSVYGNGSGNVYSVDYIRITLTYIPSQSLSVSDLVASVTETVSKEVSTYNYAVANNNQAYVMNLVTKAWSFIDNAPYSNVIYRPEQKTMIAARRDTGNICTLDADVDDYTITWTLRTGFYSFSQLDEMKDMPDEASQALKRVRRMYTEVRSTGNITCTIFTEQDSTGIAFTITPTTTDNVVYNMVRTRLSRDVRGKSISLQFSGSCRAWVGDTSLEITPRALR